MKKLAWLVLAVLCFSGAAAASPDEETILRANARGAQEVPPNNTNGSASFTATIHEDGTINFKMTFANLSTPLLVSHIHFAPTKVAGGVMIFLCGGGGQPACPAATSGTIEGTITPANVVGPTAQGITAGDLASALRAIRGGEGYVNLHTPKFPAGEIRGQVVVFGDEDGRED
jgi:hypothetical protein